MVSEDMRAEGRGRLVLGGRGGGGRREDHMRNSDQERVQGHLTLKEQKRKRKLGECREPAVR